MGRLHVSLTYRLTIQRSPRKKLLKNGVAEQKRLRSPDVVDTVIAETIIET